MAKNDTQTDEKTAKAPSPFAILSPVNVDALNEAIGSLTDEQRDAIVTALGGADAKLYVRREDQTSKTSKGAIALAIGSHGGGTYVAVPARSFVERTAAPVAAPRVKWS
jgi:hypothetical protein